MRRPALWWAVPAILGGMVLIATGVLLGASGAGRSDVGAPIAGVAAVINASSPLDDIYNGQFCGGVVVAPRIVMTAAHCVATRQARMDVVIGADNLCRSAPIDGVRIAVSAVEVHPRYDAASATFDLARLTLAEAAPTTSIRRVAAAGAAGGWAVALGWGRGSPAGVPPCRLMRTDLRRLPQDVCPGLTSAADRSFHPDSMLCAVPDREPGQDTCSGDSGGPLVDGSDPARGDVIGIVSWGRGCGGPSAGVYARADGWP